MLVVWLLVCMFTNKVFLFTFYEINRLKGFDQGVRNMQKFSLIIMIHWKIVMVKTHLINGSIQVGKSIDSFILG